MGWRLCVHRRNKIKRNVKAIMSTDVAVSAAGATSDGTSDDVTALSPEEASSERCALLRLTTERWATIVDKEGRITDPGTFYRSLLHGSCVDELRSKVWKTLLGQYSLHLTDAERLIRDTEVKTSYDALITEMQQVLETEQLDETHASFSEKSFGAQCNIIDLDVARADFTRKNFDSSDQSGEYNSQLRNVLRAVVYQNLENGYVQGMSDLLEPVLVVMDDEASAYYCFNQLLRHVGPRFDNLSEHGIQKSLMKLRQYLAYLDPDLSDHLRLLESDHMYFAYRWFLLDYKREFEAAAVFTVWEAIWASRQTLTKNFSVFIAIAIFQVYREELMKCRDFPHILKLFSDLQLKMEPAQILAHARGLVLQVHALMLQE